MLRRNGTKTGSRNLDELLFSPAEEQVKVNELRAAIGPLTGHADIYATDACLKRYLRARNWNIKKAEKMLRDSLHWRSVFKPEEIQWADISGESETGKVYRATFRDKHDHTVIVMHPTRQNTSNMDGQIKQLVYTLENTILNLPPGQEQMVWLIDFHGWGVKHSTPIKTAREIANILQNHYPERLNVGILFNPPRVFQAFMTIVKPFLDPKTFQKVKFVYTRNPESCKLLDNYFANDILKEVLENPADYNHEEYAKLMEQDDLKSATYWKLGEEDQLKDGDIPNLSMIKLEDST
jgi:hypothetical protein